MTAETEVKDEKKVYGVVYKWTNKENGSGYVGETIKNPLFRWKQHIWVSKNPKSSQYNSPFQRAIRKYGKENFSLEILAECYSKEELYEKEKFFTDFYNTWVPCGYNLKSGIGPGTVSEETKEKQSELKRGNKHPFFGKHGKDHPAFGYKHTNEAKSNMSKNKKGKYTGENSSMFGRKGPLSPFFGRRVSDELRKKNSISHIGLQSGENNPFFGKHHSIETIEKLSKTSYLISPDGIPTVITNMRKFCFIDNPELHLSPGAMCNVVKGKAKHHKGWTRNEEYYIDVS